MATPILLADHTLSAVALAIAIGGTALAAALGGAALFLARDRPSPAQIRAIVREANAPLEAMVARVAQTLEAGGAAADALAGVGQVTLDQALSQTVAAARRIGGADAAAVVWEHNGGEPRVVTSGLDDTTHHDPATFRLAAPDTRSVVVSYRHADDRGRAPEEAIHAALAVPLRAADGTAAGTLTVFWRQPGRDPSEEEVARLEELGTRAAAALDRASPERGAM